MALRPRVTPGLPFRASLLAGAALTAWLHGSSASTPWAPSKSSRPARYSSLPKAGTSGRNGDSAWRAKGGDVEAPGRPADAPAPGGARDQAADTVSSASIASSVPDAGSHASTLAAAGDSRSSRTMPAARIDVPIPIVNVLAVAIENAW